METTTRQLAQQTPSRLRIVLMWLLMLGTILFWVVFWVWRKHGTMTAEDSQPKMVVASVLDLFAGGVFLVCGAAVYLLATFTGCFSFSYARPVWGGAKVRLYFTNIIATVLLGLGMGFILAAFVRPALLMLGLDPGLATMLPLMLTIGGIQMVQLWVLIWAPMERRLIINRLVALGVQRAQLANAFLVGMSTPGSNLARRFGSIEEDMGAIWVGPEQLIYWGDGEQFGISRAQIVQIERKADNRSTTMLAGITHVILHIALPDGTIRQIRLHVEGLMTMGQKRRMMDKLAEAINRWYANTAG